MTAIELTIDPRARKVGSSTVHRLLPFHQRRMVGPFIFLDHMGPEDIAAGRRLDIDAHPHIGLSTLTYLFDGRMVHRDSTGAVQAIEPGAVNWMTAGGGVCHTERSHPDDVDGVRHHHGLQFWVALPDGSEDGPPRFQHTGADDVPAEHRHGVDLRVVAGSGWGLASPIDVSSPLVLADLTLTDDVELVIDDQHPERAILALEGDLRLDHDALPVGRLAVLEVGTRPVLRGTGRAVVIGGEPLGQRHIWWNFVHRDPERIEAAKADWAAQRFPLVPDDHDPWVPLPSS